MRQTHVPGEKAFMDYSGKRPHYDDPKTGEKVFVELFVGALGASSLTYAVATRTQSTEDWIEASTLMLEYFGGVPAILVPDNLKAAVIKAGQEPTLNRAFLEFCHHYDTVSVPARSRHPRDKAKVEAGVQVAQRWIIARLRNMQFFSQAELNVEVRRLCNELNLRRTKRIPESRRERFERIERSALKPLPVERYEPAHWTAQQTVGPDYHVNVERHWYSVPYQLVGQKIESRVTRATVEICREMRAIAIKSPTRQERAIPAHFRALQARKSKRHRVSQTFPPTPMSEVRRTTRTTGVRNADRPHTDCPTRVAPARDGGSISAPAGHASAAGLVF